MKTLTVSPGASIATVHPVGLPWEGADLGSAEVNTHSQAFQKEPRVCPGVWSTREHGQDDETPVEV